MWVWAGSALMFAVGCFLAQQWLACRTSPSRRSSTARSGFLNAAAFVPTTTAGRRGLLDASIVGAVGLIVTAVGTMPLQFLEVGRTWRLLGLVPTLCGLALFGFGWPLSALLGRPKLLRPWYARDELPLGAVPNGKRA